MTKVFHLPILCLLLLAYTSQLWAQGCCSGGSGSPIAGGTSQGVLAEHQVETGISYQYIHANTFFTGDKKTSALFDHFSSHYLYLRLAYGLTKNLTFSVESGYFESKTQVGLAQRDTIHTSGIGDLILFPRYNILTYNTEKTRNEITVGLGYKFPVGSCHDSNLVYTNPVTGHKTFTIAPPTLQPTNGSQDVLFYGFLFRGYPEHSFRLFANVLYIHKGWNALGERFGDYTGIGLFAGKNFFRKLVLTLQLKGERTGKMKYDKKVDVLAYYNVDVLSTGNKKLSMVPQLSYTRKNFTAYALTDIPLYQYVNGTQVGASLQTTLGFAYRFFLPPTN